MKVKEGATEEKCVAGPVVTRAQAKKSDKVHPLKVKEAMSSVDKSTIENLQKKDSTLKKCFDRIGKPIIRENYVGEFYKKNGLLYRKHQETKTGRSFNQLVVPKELRRQVMSVNHESAFSGHLGAKKTEVRILPNFFWPGLRQDVIRFCRSCDVCQRTVKRGSVRKVPLGSMPLIDTPFKRVAVDIVGPIAPPSEAGHRYILTLVDYATRYPEAVPLKKITTEAVAEALLDFIIFLQMLKFNFTFLGVTEIWLKDSNVDSYNITDYNVEHNYRSHKGGGGFSLFVKRYIDYYVRTDLTLSNDFLETLFIEIPKCSYSLKNIIIGVIYRPPTSDITVFNEYTDNILKTVKTEQKLCYIMGDFNVNLLNYEKHNKTADFVNMMFSHSMLPIINKPTRVTASSATIIDNIYINDNNPNTFQGLLCTDISDHLPIFYIIKKKSSCSEPNLVSVRDYSSQNIDKFTNKLHNINWDAVTNTENPNEAYKTFHNILLHEYNNCFPLNKIKVTYKNRKPWLTTGMKNAIKEKNKLFMLQKKQPYMYYKTKYKNYRNKLNNILIKAEREYYHNLFDVNKNNVIKTWSVIKDIINKKKVNKIQTSFFINNINITDKKDISNSFNDYFVSIGPELSKNIPVYNISPTSYITNNNISSMYLEAVSNNEVKDIILNLNNASPGWDNISAKIVKQTYQSFLDPLTFILNLSLKSGIVPDDLKLAKVLPLYKSKNKNLISNYRPISVLPVFSKVLERLMYNRMINYINKYKLLYPFQFGFQKNHSTNMALITLVDKISDALENGDKVLGVFLDFSKAFDTVDHTILLKKLEYYGFRGVVLKWLSNYLQNRKQYVFYNNTKSDYKSISCGVPQGSILGPLLFLLYINDITNVSNKLFLLLFADDSNAFITGKNVDQLIDTMNSELSKLHM